MCRDKYSPKQQCWFGSSPPKMMRWSPHKLLLLLPFPICYSTGSRGTDRDIMRGELDKQGEWDFTDRCVCSAHPQRAGLDQPGAPLAGRTLGGTRKQGFQPGRGQRRYMLVIPIQVGTAATSFCHLSVKFNSSLLTLLFSCVCVIWEFLLHPHTVASWSWHQYFQQ